MSTFSDMCIRKYISYLQYEYKFAILFNSSSRSIAYLTNLADLANFGPIFANLI